MCAQQIQAIQVAVADDHAVVREGIKSLLQRENGITFCGESRSGEQAVQLFQRLQPDVFLFDAARDQQDGLDIVQRIRSFNNRAKILVFSFYPESQYALPYLRAGANGYLEKCEEGDVLISAIRQIASGKKYISQPVAALLAEQLSTTSEALPHEELSSREYQIMLHLASGKTLTATATDMGLSSRTISTYRKRILRKLHLKSNVELVRYAFRNKLLTSI